MFILSKNNSTIIVSNVIDNGKLAIYRNMSMDFVYTIILFTVFFNSSRQLKPVWGHFETSW